ncbi:MAG: hypothetical protein WBA71_01955 [Candidatus Humimicrobiia bacterium]
MPSNVNLDLIFSKNYERKVNFDNTIKFKGRLILIPPSKYRISFTKCLANVFLFEDKGIYILYKKDIIHITKLSENNKDYKISKQIESFLNQREYQQFVI